MARGKKDEVQKESTSKECLECKKIKNINRDFYKHDSPIYGDNKYPICKTCIKSKLTLDDPMSQVAIESVKDVMLDMNKPFIHSLWISSIEEAKHTGKKDIFGLFKKNIDQNNPTATWKDSEFESKPYLGIKVESNETHSIQTTSKEFIVTDEIVHKWGYGYTPEEYRAFESKYAMLRNNYQEKTAMHTEALLTYIRYRVKEEIATAKGEVKEAKDWGAMAKEAATAAKINPSQLSKSDLSDGLDTFGQLVRSVEQAVDIIPMLPQFKERPQDKVDFTLLCYINYIRDLKGLPLASYEDVYQFYEERKKDYEGRDE